MTLFGLTPAARASGLERIFQAIADHLAAAPREESLSLAQVSARHAGCRGKVLCSVDREPDLAEPGTYQLFEHGERDYPFDLCAGVAEEGELWRLRDELVLWVIGRLGTGSRGAMTAAAVGWLAELDHALVTAGEPAAAHWRYIAGRVLVGLGQSGREPTAADLLAAVGDTNRQTLSRLWHGGNAHASGTIDLGRMVRIILADDGRPLEQRQALLRDLVHTTLMQLGLMASQQVPLLLFAWAQHAAGPAGKARGAST